jgi:hypothetical protein
MVWGLPVGGRLSDYHGVVAGEDLVFDPRELVTTSALEGWRFDHVPAAQKQNTRLPQRLGQRGVVRIAYSRDAIFRPSRG